MKSKRTTPSSAASPKVLRHRRPATSSPVAIGVDPASGVWLQEYWQQGKAYYAIACDGEDVQSIEIKRREQSSFAALLERPWPMAKGTVKFVELPLLPADGLIALFVHAGREDRFAGYLKVPVRPLTPAVSSDSSLYTVDGLNGTGPKIPQMWCAQDLLRYPPETESEIRLQLPGETGTLRFAGAEQVWSNMDIQVREAHSETVMINADPASIHLSTAQADPKANHLVILRVKFPASAGRPLLARLQGRVQGPTGASYPFLRGLIVDESR